MSELSSVQTVDAFMRAFREQDRERAESLMAEDFVFTSPQDDHLDKATWLERCFPTADHFDQPARTLELVEVDGVVLHRYEYAVNGRRWRNAEATTVVDGRVREVEVYFGGAID
ncbi:nuclear transport factor 2 family protein [Agromyces sp. NPDC058110]|uniref:nuclear transport factor 2 family protein n=1 Tax=Agromyces sp. NPDC058110 TaxID=3346345 RepID=UPI0036DDAAAD